MVCVTFAFTALVTIFKDLEVGYARGIWILWIFWSWNYFAYGFDRQMLPWVWVELQGHGKGKKTERTVVFWITAFLYLCFLAVMAFAES